MSLHVLSDEEKLTPEEIQPEADGTYKSAKGGTEMMNEQLYARVDPDLLSQFNIIKSRVREISIEKPNILWLHDTWDDPESQHLRDAESRKRFKKLVFVSNYQMQTYQLAHGIMPSECAVMRNAIVPIEDHAKPNDRINLIYHTTPHRGLEILIPVFEKLCELPDFQSDKIHLDIYSSFEAYGWSERDAPYEHLFERARQHPNMTYHGYQPNEVVREALKKAHIFAYPNIWPETSCIAAIEAMSAGCDIVCPNHAALPETTAGFATMYDMHEDIQKHANRFLNILYHTILYHPLDRVNNRIIIQKTYVDNLYGWDLRASEWTALLNELK